MNSRTLFGLGLSLVAAASLTVFVSPAAMAQGSQPKKRISIVATSEYICTPSGFGQKARCYLKDR